MIEKILIFIKHRFGFLWKIIEHVNRFFFSILYKKSLNNVLPKIIEEYNEKPWKVRRLMPSDIQFLFNLINAQKPSDLKYFSPHGFDLNSLAKQFKNSSFLMMGVFDEENLVGYFFLRMFVNKKCFVGRLIDVNYRGKGIGLIMNQVMYKTAWGMGFRCLSTISKNNKAVVKAHEKNSSMVILKELQNDYLLIEFVK
ncbi:GNAT family N-acetyltransferase [Labilibacter sediminis]|nr:GNAT family N-acetyltransferase [Labilibacter sediminis]